ncbi:MAG: GNAT family N-acetyltransferase [Chloroflexi bacterium]|nr:GNAT family N-acetyltransferase [Chloroflexota bacterium]
MVTLEPMSVETWEQWRVASVRGYAADKVRVGAWPAEGAEARADREFTELLPQGLDTPDHELRSIVNESGEVVGTLWFGPLRERSRSTCFIWDIEVVAEARGRGYGRAALLALEPIARDLGYDAIGLHVVGDNEVARHLYRSSGYMEADVMMRKTLG